MRAHALQSKLVGFLGAYGGRLEPGAKPRAPVTSSNPPMLGNYNRVQSSCRSRLCTSVAGAAFGESRPAADEPMVQRPSRAHRQPWSAVDSVSGTVHGERGIARTERTYAELMARARAAGLAIGATDGYIAAIAAANGMMVATRDISPFEAAGVSVINPWEAQATPPGSSG